MSLALLPPALLPPDGADAVGDEPAPEADDDEPVVVSVDGLALVLDELPPVSDFAVSLVPLGVVVVDPDDDVDGDVTDAEPDDDVAEPEPDDVADPEADGDVPVAGGDGVDGDVDDGGEADGERPPCAVVSVPDSVQPAAATATIAIPPIAAISGLTTGPSFRACRPPWRRCRSPCHRPGPGPRQ